MGIVAVRVAEGEEVGEEVQGLWAEGWLGQEGREPRYVDRYAHCSTTWHLC